MKEILTLNKISPLALGEFPDGYALVDTAEAPLGILLRSFDMHTYDLPASVLAVARAGAGTNNIPSADYAAKGVAVFNTPGANADAVKELVLCALFLGGRKIIPAIRWTEQQKGKGAEIPALVEKGKKEFAGCEIGGKTLGVIGLGAIGIRVANAALALGMTVVGYDPYLSVENALMLSRGVSRVASVEEIYRQSDFITLHVPLLADNRGMIGEKAIAAMKDGAVLINCARGELADNEAVIRALRCGKLARYITDFAADELLGEPGAICLPHLGASTPEAEDNCAVMAAKELYDYLAHGNITHSVNLPDCTLPRSAANRMTCVHLNRQNMIAQITACLGRGGVNIENFIDKSRGDYAYTIIDTNDVISPALLRELEEVEGVIRVRLL